MTEKDVGGSAEGDPEAWLSEAYATAYRTAVLILHNRAEAEEAVQDALLRAWRFRDSVSEPALLRPWLYRIVVNTCCSALRRQSHGRDRRAEEPAFGALASPAPSPEDTASESDLAGRLALALAGLPDALRIPLILRYYSGLSERGIAVAIQRRPGTVKSRLHEARRRLALIPELQDLSGVGGVR